MLKPETSLDLMKHCFPSWSNIRKRTKKSSGGSLLTAYSKEFGNIQDAIEAYQKIFFLVNYKGKEEDFPDHLFAAVIGKGDIVAVDSLACTVTENEDDFLDNLNSMALRSGSYLLFHEQIVPKDAKAVLYTLDGEQYSAGLVQIPIWNVFDEFAKFAGLERYAGETNKELEARTYAVFKNFPNPTDEGLKKAIMNAVVPQAEIRPEDIVIEQFNDKLDVSEKDMNDIYESFVQFNHDIFRTKVWNVDNWENGFQKTGYLPHAWDKPMEVTRNGVGYNDSLKVSYLKDLDTSGLTDIDAYAYKKDFQTVSQYVKKNHVQDDISLKLTRYKDDIQPKKISYAIRAYGIRKLENPQGIIVRSMKRSSGPMAIGLEDIAMSTEGVQMVERGFVDAGLKYRLVFQPKDDFAKMTVSRCMLSGKDTDINLLHEQDQYVYRGKEIVNSHVKAHVTSVIETSWNDNVVDSHGGITIGNKKASGAFDVNVKGMENEMVTMKASCREVDISDTPYVGCYNGFVRGKDGRSFTDATQKSIGSVVVGGPDNPLLCNSFTFTFDSNAYPIKQGAILVTILADGQEERLTCNHGTTVHREYKKRIPVQIVIQKYGENPVTVRDFKMSSYDIGMSMTNGGRLSHLGSVVRLPSEITAGMSLHIEIVPYTSAYPVVSYVHIGGSLKGASYVVDFDTPAESGLKLSIDTDCDTTLYRLDSFGNAFVVGEERKYTTKSFFRNETEEAGYVFVDLGNFISIDRTEPEMQKVYRDGTAQAYIEVAPGETIDTLLVVGSRKQILTERPLTHYILGDDFENWNAYASKAGKEIILWNAELKVMKKVELSRAAFPEDADSFSFTNIQDDVRVDYIFDNGMREEVSDATVPSKFTKFDFVYKDADESVAYNDYSMISDTADGVEVVNTFSPAISMTRLFYYEVEQPSDNHETTIVFEDTGASYSLGSSSKLRITTTPPGMNRENWPLEVRTIKDSFVLANEIMLDESYMIDGSWHELQEYIVEPPEGLELHYALTDQYQEEVIVPESRITKLRYTHTENVVVDGCAVKADCEIMKKEGVIVWLKSDIVGRKMTVRYNVERPSYLSYTKEYEDKLYKIVEYKDEAYKLAEERHFQQKKDGDKLLLAWKEQPSRVITKCSNPAFAASIRDGVMSVVQVKDDDRLAVHNGYIYDAGREYYFFTNKYKDQVERANSVEFHNVSRQRDNMLFHMKSRNFLPNANMETDTMAPLCKFDFVGRPHPGVSGFDHMTACDSYNLWYAVNMDVSIEQVWNGYGLHFRSKRGIGYAALDVTKCLHKGNIVSLYVSGDIKASIVEETTIDGMPFQKSVYLDMNDSIEFEKDGNYCSLLIKKDPEEDAKCYLVLSGTDGRIDDMVSMPADSSIEIKDAHVKNIDALGMAIEETAPAEFERKLEFTTDGASYEDAACSSEMELMTASSVEYGLTYIGSVDLDKCSFEYADFKDGSIVSTHDGAIVKTRPYYVKSSSSAFAVYIKVNEIIGNKYSGFNIRVYGSDTLNNGYALIKEITDENMVTLEQQEVKNYLYLEIIADKGKVISSVETYARYAEFDGTNLPLEQKEHGSFTSKVYDTGMTADYRFDGADAEMAYGDEEDVSYFIRGIRSSKNKMVMTGWKKYDASAIDPVVLKDYRLVQFKVDIHGQETAVRVHLFNLGVV